MAHSWLRGSQLADKKYIFQVFPYAIESTGSIFTKIFFFAFIYKDSDINQVIQSLSHKNKSLTIEDLEKALCSISKNLYQKYRFFIPVIFDFELLLLIHCQQNLNHEEKNFETERWKEFKCLANDD